METPVEKISVWERVKRYFKLQTKNFWKNRTIVWFLIPALCFTIVLGYVPMLGVIFGFKEQINPSNWFYDVLTQPFTFKWVAKIFSDAEVLKAIGNTLIISGFKLVIIFPLNIVMAILLSEIKNQRLSKLLLIILCLPNFLSWPVTIGIWNNIVGLDSGLLNNLISSLGGERIYFFQDHFKAMVIFLSAWKSLGWGSIYFYAAILSIDKEYYEAATIDGATKLQKIRYLTIPGIKSVIALMLVMNITYILDAGFDQVYSMLNVVKSITYDEQILGTYIFNLGYSGDIPFSVAMSVVNGLFALILMLGGNTLVQKKLGRSLW